MKKQIILASAALAAAAFGFETWVGGVAGSYQVNTGFGDADPELNKAGYWFDYADDADGGKSGVTWPTGKGNEYSTDALDPIIDLCQGVCGTITLNKGTLSYDPFVGIGFNVAGENGETADVTSWGGICIAYDFTGTGAKATLELGLGDAGDAAIGSANPAATLKVGTGNNDTFTWDDFKQPGWEKADQKIATSEAIAKLVAVKFKVQGKDGSYQFNIMSIGPATGGACKVTGGSGTTPSGNGGGTTPSGDNGGSTTPSGDNGGTTPAPAAIGDFSVSTAKAILSGRTLSFSGISSAKVEILNLQGQIVMKGSAASSMNLMGLDAGVYMVRIAGKAVNMSQKILVK